MADETPEVPTASPLKRCRLLKVFAVVIVGLIVSLVAAPWVLSTSLVQTWLVNAANSAMGPGKLRLNELALSWTGPLQVSGLSLTDPQGKPVLAARSITTDRGLLGLLNTQRDFGKITIDGAVLDVERRDDGTVDLIDALGSLLKKKEAKQASSGVPSPTLVVDLKNCSVRVRSPELAAPFEAREVNGTVQIAPGKPIDVSATLVDATHAIELQASVDAESEYGDVFANISAKDWPIAVRQPGVQIKGRWDGTVTVRQERGLWDIEANVGLGSLVADGPALAGDQLRFDRVKAVGHVAQTAMGWSIAKFDVTTPVGSISANGTVPASADAPTRLDGSIDLAKLSKLAPRAMRLREGLRIDRGQVRVLAELELREGSDHLVAIADIDDLGATEDGHAIALKEPTKVETRVVRKNGTITVESLHVHAAGLDATASGDLEQGVKLTGKIDLKEVQDELGELLEMGGVQISGRGGLAADYRRDGENYQGRFAAEFANLHISGPTEAPIHRDRARLDASVVGLRAASGLPKNWRAGRIALRAGETQADINATEERGSVALAVVASTEVTKPTPGRIEAKGSLHWKGSAVTIDEIHAGLQPHDEKAGAETVALALKGRFDLEKGTIELGPLPGAPTGAIGLADGGLRVEGLGQAHQTLKADASLVGDLGALDRLLVAWSGPKQSGIGGAYTARLHCERGADQRLVFSARAEVRKLATPRPRGAVVLSLVGSYETKADQLDLPTFEVITSYGTIKGRATVADLNHQRMADLAANVEPRWEGLDSLIAGSLGTDGRVRASVRPIALRGPLVGGTITEVLRDLEGTIALDVTVAQAFGVTLGQTPIVLRLTGGRAAFDTIQTTINEGTAIIGADLALDDPNALWLRLAPGSKIEHARINEVVSSAVLAYVAPVLSEASEVDGTLRVAIRQGAIPLIGDGSTLLDGDIVFENVVFEPGPGASEVLALAGQRVPRLALNQPIQLQVAEGRVRQNGLKIPVNRETQIALAGSVGFDKTLQLRATMPLSAKMLGRDETVQQLLAGTQVTVPIGGTLSKPGIDRQALQATLRQAMQQVARRGLEAGAGRLLERALGNVAGDAKPAPESGSIERDAKKMLENLGREILGPRRP